MNAIEVSSRMSNPPLISALSAQAIESGFPIRTNALFIIIAFYVFVPYILPLSLNDCQSEVSLLRHEFHRSYASVVVVPELGESSIEPTGRRSTA